MSGDIALELMYMCKSVKMMIDDTVSEIDKVNNCCDAEENDYVDEDDGTRLYAYITDVPSHIVEYTSLSRVTIDAWDFHRGVHVKADMFNGMSQLKSLTLKGVIVNTDELTIDQILNVPSLESLQLLYIDGLRGLDIQPVLDRLSELKVLKLKAFDIGVPGHSLDLSGLEKLEKCVVAYYMQSLPIVSSNNVSLTSLKIKRTRPENAVNLGGCQSDEETIEWTPLPEHACIHNIDWSSLKDTPLSTLELHGVFHMDTDGKYLHPVWLDTLIQEGHLTNLHVQYICTLGHLDNDHAVVSSDDDYDMDEIED